MKHIKLFEDFRTPFWLYRALGGTAQDEYTRDCTEGRNPEFLQHMKNLGIDGEDYYEYFDGGNEDGPKKPSGKVPDGMTKQEWYDRLRKFMPDTYNKYCISPQNSRIRRSGL